MYVKYRQFGSYDLFAVRKVDSLLLDVHSVPDGWVLRPLGEARPLAWFETYGEAASALTSLCAALAAGKTFFNLSECETKMAADC